MTVLLKNGALFFHIPKTAGWWVLSALKELDLVRASFGHDHADYDRVLWHDRFHRDGKVLRGILRRYIGSPSAPIVVDPKCFKFCFVREPLRWYESYWRFMESLNWKRWGDERLPHRWHPCAVLNGLGSPDFNTFMYNVNKKRPGYVTEMFGSFARPGVRCGKMESLEQDLMKMLALMKVDFDPATISAIPKENVTCSQIPKPEWDPALRKATLELEHAGYVRFGYPIEGKARTSGQLVSMV